jgi:DNA topoisomerase VI subunit B
MRKLFFSTGTIGLGIAVAALFAWSHAVTPLQATTASSSINPTQIMANLQGSATS